MGNATLRGFRRTSCSDIPPRLRRGLLNRRSGTKMPLSGDFVALRAPTSLPACGGLWRHNVPMAASAAVAEMVRESLFLRDSAARPAAACAIPPACGGLAISHQKISTQASLVLIFCYLLAEEEGFEPPVRCRTTVFKTAAIDHSAIPPFRD